MRDACFRQSPKIKVGPLPHSRNSFPNSNPPSLVSPHAHIKRGGTIHHIPSSQIVTGDILVLEAGDIVAADARLLTAASLRCDESTPSSPNRTNHEFEVSANNGPHRLLNRCRHFYRLPHCPEKEFSRNRKFIF